MCVSAGAGAEGTQAGRTCDRPQEGDGHEEGGRQKDLCRRFEPRCNGGYHQGIFRGLRRGQFCYIEPLKLNKNCR